MDTAMTPPFHAEQVGSLLRPKAILDAREDLRTGKITQADLAKIEDDEIRKAVRLQEDIGFKVVSDGEYRRDSWNRDFLLKLSNVVLAKSRISVGGASADGQTSARLPTAMAVTGKLTRPKPIFVDHFAFLKSVTKVTPKLTIPSPTILHFRGGRDAVDKTAYPRIEDFFADCAKAYNAEIDDLAAAGCTYLQVDDVNFAYICDPRVAEQIKAMGEDAAQLPHTYATLINAAIANHPKTMTVGLHLCRGNAPTGSTEGGYDQVAETIFNEIDVSCYFLEFDSARAGDFEPLRFLPKNKTVVLGLVSTKTRQLEDKADVIRRIREAEKFVPLDQLAISPQCGFSSGASSTIAKGMTMDEQRAKLQLVVDVAKEVWGSA